jgi:hypothetical protein
MAARRGHENSRGIGRWLWTLLGVSTLVFLGFGVGLVVGVVAEEPELVLSHWAGRSTEIEWGPGTLLAGARTSADDTSARDDFELLESPDDGIFGLAPVGAGPAAVARVSSHSDSKFSIQVGAFENSDSAWSLAERLRNSGYPVRVLEPRADGRWRVRVGPVAGRATADKMAQRLNDENRLPTWVLHEPGS